MHILKQQIDVVVFDLEIANAIEEVGGWKNTHLMGVSFAAMYSYKEDVCSIYDMHNLADMVKRLNEADLVVSFNGTRFDYKVLVGCGFEPPFAKQDYDILAEAWRASGLNPDKFDEATHGGYGLNNMAKATINRGKTGTGAHAPLLFQQQKYAELINYLVNDVRLTKQLFDYIDNYHKVIVPRRGVINIAPPMLVYNMEQHREERQNELLA